MRALEHVDVQSFAPCARYAAKQVCRDDPAGLALRCLPLCFASVLSVCICVLRFCVFIAVTLARFRLMMGQRLQRLLSGKWNDSALVELVHADRAPRMSQSNEKPKRFLE